MMQRTIAVYTAGRDNNFNLIRLLLAVLVILHHAFVLSSNGSDDDPILKLTGIGVGFLALNLFFVLSGFLVSMSYTQRRDPLVFMESRVLRIFPGLIVAVLFNALVLGSIFTTLPLGDYLRRWDVYDFILTNSTLILRRVQLRYFLPGVFESNPYGPAVNGSLWTLPYEFWMYFLLLGIGIVGLLKNQKRFNLVFVAFFVQLVVGQAFFRGFPIVHSLDTYMQFAAFFLLGVFYYMNREWIPVNIYIGLFLLAAMVLLRSTPLFPLILFITLSYWLFLAAYLPGGLVRKYNQLGDYSYGVYIYGFPLQQAIVALKPEISAVSLAIISLFVALVLAALSWHLVEKPALGLKGKFSGWLKARFRRQVA